MRLSAWGAALGHAGLGVTVAGIAGMSLATERVVLLHPGESASVGGYAWALQRLDDAPGPNYAERVATLAVTRGGAPVTVLHPSRRSFPVQRQTVTEAAIRTTGFSDLYAVLGEERDGGAVMRLHVNPLAPWIWLGGLVMALGGLLSLLDRRLRVGAPARRAVPAAAQGAA